MKWLLVALVMDTPVKTDLVYDNLADCMAAETEMRKAWSELYNDARKSGNELERAGQISKAMTTGTCIPSK
jgi:hypothetical protein